jgi:NAD(P)H dehydrogenase (quinone)
LTYTIIREGLYAEGIPRLLSYNAESTEVILPADGSVAWAKRSELAEGSAHIVQAPSSKFANQTILLSGASTTSLTECAGIISKLKGKNLSVRRVTNDEYIKEALACGVNEFLAKLLAETYTALENGECATVAPTLEELLGRQPTSVEDFLRETIV